MFVWFCENEAPTKQVTNNNDSNTTEDPSLKICNKIHTPQYHLRVCIFTFRKQKPKMENRIINKIEIRMKNIILGAT
jgi:hypothetical protein